VDGGTLIMNDPLDAADIMLPPAYPNGFEAFYCMKYPFTQGFLVDFLNHINTIQQKSLINNLEGDIYPFRLAYEQYVRAGIIAIWDSTKSGGFIFGLDDNQNKVLNEEDDGESVIAKFNQFIEYRDYDNWINELELLLSILDWSGLRPITELEYEKACRGPLMPVPGEYAWGDVDYKMATARFIGADYYILRHRLIDAGTATESVQFLGEEGVLITDPVRVGILAAPGHTRSQSGATFWGIMNMSTGRLPMVGISNISFNRTPGDGYIQDRPVTWRTDIVNYFVLRGSVSQSFSLEPGRTAPAWIQGRGVR
jgi:hypothetical protein